MITAEGSPRHHALVSRVLLNLLHDPVLLITPDSLSTEAILALSPLEAINIIQTFLTNTDPAPTLVSIILSPIATSLYALLGTLARTKTADPILRESVRGLLLAWGRVVPVEEAVAILWACLDGQGGDWAVDISGNVRRVEKCVSIIIHESRGFIRKPGRIKTRHWLSSRPMISKKLRKAVLLTSMPTSWTYVPTLHILSIFSCRWIDWTWHQKFLSDYLKVTGT